MTLIFRENLQSFISDLLSQTVLQEHIYYVHISTTKETHRSLLRATMEIRIKK